MCLWDLCLVSVVLEISIWLRRLTGSRLFFVVVPLLAVFVLAETEGWYPRRGKGGGDSVLRQRPLRYVMFKGLSLSHALSFTCFHTRSLSLSLSLTCTCIRNGAPSQTAHFESSESLQSQNIPVSDLIYGVTMCVRVIKRCLPCEGSQPWLIAV